MGVLPVLPFLLLLASVHSQYYSQVDKSFTKISLEPDGSTKVGEFFVDLPSKSYYKMQFRVRQNDQHSGYGIAPAIESAPASYAPQPKPTFEPVKTYQPAKATYQPIKSTYQPIKTTYQPIKSTYQPIKSNYQPVKPTYPEPIKATYKPIKSTYQPIAPTYPEAKSTLEPVKSTYQPSKPAYQPTVLEVQDTKKTYQPLPTEPVFKPSPIDYQPTPPTYQEPLKVVYHSKPIKYTKQPFKSYEDSTYAATSYPAPIIAYSPTTPKPVVFSTPAEYISQSEVLQYVSTTFKPIVFEDSKPATTRKYSFKLVPRNKADSLELPRGPKEVRDRAQFRIVDPNSDSGLKGKAQQANRLPETVDEKTETNTVSEATEANEIMKEMSTTERVITTTRPVDTSVKIISDFLEDKDFDQLRIAEEESTTMGQKDEIDLDTEPESAEQIASGSRAIQRRKRFQLFKKFYARN